MSTFDLESCHLIDEKSLPLESCPKEGGDLHVEPPQPGLRLVYKLLFYLTGLLSAITICLLINFSNIVAAKRKTESLKHFAEIISHVGQLADLGGYHGSNAGVNP